MRCVEMELGEPDASGRRRPIVKEGSEFVLDVDTMIMSIGTSPNPLIRHTTPGLETNRHGCIVTNGEDGLTSRRRRRHRRGDGHPRHGRGQTRREGHRRIHHGDGERGRRAGEAPNSRGAQRNRRGRDHPALIHSNPFLELSS